jgi:hypothetical protein
MATLQHMRSQYFLRVARLALLTRAHPVHFAQWAQYTRSVSNSGPVQYSSGARAGWYRVRGCERVGGGRHDAEMSGTAESLWTLEWSYTALRVCLVGANAEGV